MLIIRNHFATIRLMVNFTLTVLPGGPQCFDFRARLNKILIKCREEFWTEEVSTTLAEIAALLETAGPYQNYCRSKGDAAGRELLDEFITK